MRIHFNVVKTWVRMQFRMTLFGKREKKGRHCAIIENSGYKKVTVTFFFCVVAILI